MKYIPTGNNEKGTRFTIGDFYAAGVMFGLLQDWDIMRCAQAGSGLAAHGIQTIGTTLPDSEWNEIRQQVSAL